MSATVILGLLLTLGATFVSTALLVRTSFGRGAHPITRLPAPLVFYGLWVSAWFVYENVRQFALTAVSPMTGLRLVALIFLAASLLLLAFVYACLAVVHQFLETTATRRARRIARYVAVGMGGLLIVGWSGYHFNGDAALFTMVRRVVGYSALPVAVGAWTWLLVGARRVSAAAWRRHILLLARIYVALFAVALGTSLVRDRLEAVAAPIPLIADVALVLLYTLVTVLWAESARDAV